MTSTPAQPEYPEHHEGSGGHHRRPGYRRPPADLDVLRTHPSLTSLTGRGSLLDRIPASSTAMAFVAALLVSLPAFGIPGALIAVLGLALAVPLAASALLHRDVAAARAVLRVARGALLTWAVIAALFLPAGGTGSGTQGGRDADGSTSVGVSSSGVSSSGISSSGISSSDPAADSMAYGVGSAGAVTMRNAPLGGRGGGTGKAGAGHQPVERTS